MPHLRVVYEPAGAAREYAALAVNLYRGCGHGCVYCYVPGIFRLTRESWNAEIATPRPNILENLEHDCQILEMEGCRDEILLCFTTDPYHPGDTSVTRAALEIIGGHGLNATVLTKGGWAASEDFDLLTDFGFRFGTSMVCLDDDLRKVWEPRTASIKSRLDAIEFAHVGIKTWLSIEPVIDPGEALEVIERTHGVVDHFMIGKINHSATLGKCVDWVKFRQDATVLLESVGASYTFKKSLSQVEA